MILVSQSPDHFYHEKSALVIFLRCGRRSLSFLAPVAGIPDDYKMSSFRSAVRVTAQTWKLFTHVEEHARREGVKAHKWTMSAACRQSSPTYILFRSLKPEVYHNPESWKNQGRAQRGPNALRATPATVPGMRVPLLHFVSKGGSGYPASKRCTWILWNDGFTTAICFLAFDQRCQHFVTKDQIFYDFQRTKKTVVAMSRRNTNC